MTIGLRVNASAMPVPSSIRSVAAAATARGTVAERYSSGAQRRAMPARSAARAKSASPAASRPAAWTSTGIPSGAGTVRVSQPLRPIAPPRHRAPHVGCGAGRDRPGRAARGPGDRRPLGGPRPRPLRRRGRPGRPASAYWSTRWLRNPDLPRRRAAGPSSRRASTVRRTMVVLVLRWCSWSSSLTIVRPAAWRWPGWSRASARWTCGTSTGCGPGSTR